MLLLDGLHFTPNKCETEQIINKFILSGILEMDNINSTNLFKAVRMIPFKNQGNKDFLCVALST